MTSPSFLRLSELSSLVVSVIEKAFGNKSFWVVADVSSHTYKAHSNYHYFELVEKDTHSNVILAKFAGRAWGTGSQRIAAFEQVTGQRFGNDIQVLVSVTIEYHAGYGLQLCVSDIDPNYTLGALEQQRLATLARLVKENPGYVSFDGVQYHSFNRSLRLNCVVQRIAVLSSSTSAGFQDFMHTLENNRYGYRFQTDHYPVLVQGENNARLMVDKLVTVYRSDVRYDVVVIVRGGGAQSDLLLFNDYFIGKAIARFPIPVITGIGHQRNETIADVMAHSSTKTPTQAAEFIIAHNRKFEDALTGFEKRIVIKSQQLLSAQVRLLSGLNSAIIHSGREYMSYYKESLAITRQKLTDNSKSALYRHRSDLQYFTSILASSPKVTINNNRTGLKNISANLNIFNGMYFRNRLSGLERYTSMIRLMSPDNILKKGFAIVRAGGKIVTGPDEIEEGSEISVLLGKTDIRAKVESKNEYGGSEFNL